MAKLKYAMDFNIHINRPVRPVYSDLLEELLNPDLECLGPSDYNLQYDVEYWLHGSLKDYVEVTGHDVYKYLHATDALQMCLNMQDGLAIQAKGIKVFRKVFFDGRFRVCLWGSAWRNRHGLSVPFLYSRGNRVVLGERWMDHNFDAWHLAPRFRDKTQV